MSQPKQLWTSYFAKAAKHPKAMAITVVVPRWITIPHCPALAPTGLLLTWYKKGRITAEQYTELYLGLLAKRGNTPQQVVDSLEEGTVLLCFERDTFCHRHIAAGWLRRAGPHYVTIQELP